ncbi:hypothetical protein GF325_07960 [Candidatus Bathyarchaeota archaeon]|nr:hypothetical protein [Candidatus Bathyarchaeota archaeon]
MDEEHRLEKFKKKSIEDQISEILDYMTLIKRNLMGDKFSSIKSRFYNLETFEHEACPECGKQRQKFFLMLQPGQDLFNQRKDDRVISDFKIFCLECTKKLDEIMARKNVNSHGNHGER